TDAESIAYALEGGQALLDYAPVTDALCTLRLPVCELELTPLSQWLRAIFWAQPGAAERAQLDVWLRTVVPLRLNVLQLLQALRAAPPTLLAHADAIGALLLAILEAWTGTPATLAEWSGRYAKVLALCGL